MLNETLELQQRSTQFTLAARSMFGLEMQSLTGKLWEFDWLRRARREP